MRAAFDGYPTTTPEALATYKQMCVHPPLVRIGRVFSYIPKVQSLSIWKDGIVQIESIEEYGS